MALQGCYAILKYIVVIVNFIIWLAGLAVLGISIWLLTDTTFYVSLAQDETSYYTGIYILLGAGILMVIVGFLGFCGAFIESQCLLFSFFFFLFIILVAEIVAGVWTYLHSDSLVDAIKESVMKTVQEEYDGINSRSAAFDGIQRGLKCCGANTPSDWAGSAYSGGNKDSAMDVLVRTSAATYKVPQSCCVDEDQCKDPVEIKVGANSLSAVHKEGCTDKLIDFLKSNLPLMVGIGIGFIIIEVLGLIFSMVLCCAVRNMDRYKA